MGEGYKNRRILKEHLWYPSPGALARGTLSRWDKYSPEKSSHQYVPNISFAAFATALPFPCPALSTST